MRAAALTALAVLNAGLALPALAAQTPDEAAVVAARDAYVHAFNARDEAASAAMCTKDTVIIDEFAPFVWQGAKACSIWWEAEAADDAKNGITGLRVTIDKPRALSVKGDRAYVVSPALATYTQKGKPGKLPGEWTMAFVKTASGWQLTGWNWADH